MARQRSKRLYNLSPDSTEALEEFLEEDPIGLDLDVLESIKKLMAKLSQEDFEALLYPFGKPA